jgi:hypothetical protein
MNIVFDNKIILYGSEPIESLEKKVIEACERSGIDHAVKVFCWTCANAPRREQLIIKKEVFSSSKPLPPTESFKAKRKEFRKVVEQFFYNLGYDEKLAGRAYFGLKGYYGLK